MGGGIAKLERAATSGSLPQTLLGHLRTLPFPCSPAETTQGQGAVRSSWGRGYTLCQNQWADWTESKKGRPRPARAAHRKLLFSEAVLYLLLAPTDTGSASI